MKLRRGKWRYKLPDDTYQLLNSYLCVGMMDYSIMQVSPETIHDFRKRDTEKHGIELYGYVSHIAMQTTDKGIFLLTYPMPDKANNLKCQATRIFEI